SYDAKKQVALLTAPSGEMLVVAGKEAKHPTDLLTPIYDQPNPGQSLYFSVGTEMHAHRERLLGSPAFDITWQEREWGWETLRVVDPDGYVVSFWGGRALSEKEILHYYDQAPSRLQNALEGLTEADLDLARAPGKWSIRQIVLHIVDSDCTSLALVKFALAEPGRSFSGNAYDPDVWAAGLDYANRPINAEVELFGAIRKHIGGLLRHIPSALERTVTLVTGQTVAVRRRIEPLMGHALHHIEQIWETRQVHG
ncbi:DinB family protein, partial [Microbacteriaceae bacterium K1510]|nr:DinB family protein [Microbacteriaceae bacterium K1510]